MNKLTPEQLAAIHSEHDDYVVSAAAGSGKTTVLTQRYLHLVQKEGLRPDQILTITFTKKAAAEMKERIVGLLRDAQLSDLAQEAETGPVQTISAFCDRLLKENAIAAGIDPGFDTLPSIGPWVDEELREIMGESGMLDPLVDAFILEKSDSDRFGNPNLSDIVGKILGAVRGTHWRPDALRALAASRESLAEPFRPYLEARSSSDKLDKHRSEDIIETVLNPEIARWGGYRYKRVEKTLANLDLTRGALLLACEVWDALERRFEREQQFDFAEIERRAVQLLETNESVRDRLRRHYRALLLDEAQDNNPVQNRLISLLGIQNQMVVGDPQQSIYGFRQAAPHLFLERIQQTQHLRLSKNKRSTQQVLGFIDGCFSARWGSDYEPMSDFDLDTPATDFSDVEFWVANKESYYETMAQNVFAMIEGQGVPPGEIAVLSRSRDACFEAMMALRRRGIDAEMSSGRRFHSRMVVRDVANMLEALLNPQDDFALFAVLRSPFVGLSLDACVRCALNKPIFNHLVDVAFSREDRDRADRFLSWFEEAAESADRLSAWEALSLVYRKSKLIENLARLPDRSQTIANARKLLVMAAGDREIRPQDFANNIRRWQSHAADDEGDAPTSDPNAPVVRLLTIHSAKGLEFPYVILPETDLRYGQVRFSSVRIDAEKGLFYLTDGEKQWPEHILEEIAREQLMKEEQRIDYVAMTRAKKKLIFMMPEPLAKKDKCLANELKSLFWPPEGVRGGIVVRETPAIVSVDGG